MERAKPKERGPAPSKGVELCLAHLTAGFAEEDVVIGGRIKRRIEVDEIDGRVRELFRVPQPLQIIDEVEPVHREECGRDSHSVPLRASEELRASQIAPAGRLLGKQFGDLPKAASRLRASPR